MNKPEYIIIHHSATKDGTLKDFDAIKRYHIEHNGWRDIGYHYVIEKIGSTYVVLPGRAETDSGAHTREEGMNYRSLGICCVGNFDVEQPSEEMLKVLADLIVSIRRRYGQLPIAPHKKFSNTSCPGANFNMNKLIAMVAEKESEHWANRYYEYLINKGYKIYEKNFDEPMTRGEVFKLIALVSGMEE